MFRVLASLLILLSLSLPALAQNTGGIFPPVINDGHKSPQYRATIDPDNASGETGFAQRLHYQQAIDGEFMWRVVGQTRKTDASDLDFDFVQAELFWQITPDEKKHQSGLRFDARYRGDDRPEQFGLNWTNQFKLGGNWSARAIGLTAVQTGDNSASGIFLQTRGNLYRKVSGKHTVGVEMFNNFGNSKDFGKFKEQSHTFGPFISTPVADNLALYGGAQFGISGAAADTELRFWVTRGF